MAGRLYRMAKVVSANPKSWGIVDANEISGFKRVAKLSDLYSIAECILSSSYGDGVTDGADAVGQIWHVSETNGDYKLTNWANRKSAAGWTKLSYGGDVSVPVKDVQVTKDNVTASVLSNGIANINLTDYAKKSDVTDNLKNYIAQAEKGVRNGVAPLDRDNMIPLQYLGHLDMTVFTVVESLPTSDIENKVYLVKSSLTSDKNIYSEYIYTGNRNGVYDATKWEKLGEVAAETDLSEYYKKTEVYNKNEINTKVGTLNDADIQNFTITPHSRGVQGAGILYYMQASITRKGNTSTALTATIPCVNTTDGSKAAGLMSPVDKIKLDGIAEGANKYSHPRYTAAPEGLYKISADTFGHVFTTTPVTNKDIDPLVTIDSTLSSTSNHPVSSKAIYTHVNEYTVHTGNMNASTGDSILDGKYTIPFIDCDQIAKGYSPLHYANDAIIMTSQDGNINLKIDKSTFWSDSNLTALTDTELNEILK